MTVTLKVIEKLKASLAEALELYPPMTGTLKISEDGKEEVYIALDEESVRGTPFLVEFRDVPYEKGEEEGLSPRTEMLIPHSASILAVKVTQ
ncbi:hypothetical protein BGW39_011843, partial [Mortierella sp. 14UC]